MDIPNGCTVNTPRHAVLYMRKKVERSRTTKMHKDHLLQSLLNRSISSYIFSESIFMLYVYLGLLHARNTPLSEKASTCPELHLSRDARMPLSASPALVPAEDNRRIPLSSDKWRVHTDQGSVHKYMLNICGLDWLWDLLGGAGVSSSAILWRKQLWRSPMSIPNDWSDFQRLRHFQL